MKTSKDRTCVSFIKKKPTLFNLLIDPSEIDNVFFCDINKFKFFLKNLIADIKRVKCNFFNSLIEQLITIFQERDERNEYTDMLSQILIATSIVVTKLPPNVYLKKLKRNKFTDTIDYLILPSFILWDHNVIIFLNKAFNSKNGLVDISGSIQKIKFTHGIIKDQFQSKNGYAGQFLYSTFLNTASFYANVQCFNGLNEIIPPKASIQRYYGRNVSNIRAWTTRHPNISQLSTQISDVRQPVDHFNWSVKVGTGIFPGANTDCDGDKKVITFLPKPNSLIDLECLLYGDPRYNFICFDKNRLSFVSQQIYYLFKNRTKIVHLLKSMPMIYTIWSSYPDNMNFANKLEAILHDCTLVLNSNVSYLLYKQLTELIADEEMICGDKEIFDLSGIYTDVIESGAKGTYDLINSTKNYKSTKITDIDTVANRAIKSLNNYIQSHYRVKVGGGDIYHNTTVLQNIYLKNDYICYKNDSVKLGSLCVLPSEFLFPEHLLDLFIDK
jgi:Late expression factor 9 (LEF-9)